MKILNVDAIFDQKFNGTRLSEEDSSDYAESQKIRFQQLNARRMACDNLLDDLRRDFDQKRISQFDYYSRVSEVHFEKQRIEDEIRLIFQ